MNLDTRPLLATKTEIYVRPSSLAAGESICNFCFMAAQSVPCPHAPKVERCGHFVPALAFVDATGLDGSFSTYRGSSIWYDRSRVLYRSHRRVGLVNKDAKILGYAELVDAHRSTFAQLMRDHAETNHLVRDLGLKGEEAAAWLTKWIKTNMGSRYVTNPEAVGTVLYLKRVE